MKLVKLATVRGKESKEFDCGLCLQGGHKEKSFVGYVDDKIIFAT